jgi:ABC-type iron transport system FetAB ATPase subunit
MADRLFEALKLGKRIPDSDTFLFKGTRLLLTVAVELTIDLSFRLDRGEIIAVRGPSGCGSVLNSSRSDMVENLHC